MDNIANKECGFEHEIVSYMYDEMDAAGGVKFETHLVDCTSCTDEFAEISHARFSVFEWQKEEFAHLATPEIVIPYEVRKVVAEKAGWFAGLAEVFAFARSPLAFGAAFVVVLGIGVSAFNLLGTDDGLIAANTTVPPVVVIDKVELPKAVDVPVATLVGDDIVPNEVRPLTDASSENSPKVSRRTSPSRRTVAIPSVPNPTRQARRAPVLSDLGDEDEDSLRLSEMFDEIGG